mgnify:FL=1|jgi:predicted HicB family RNase H-like nuclease
MAKKNFNISSTLKKNKQEATLPKKVELKKTTKDIDLVKETVEQLHSTEPVAKEVKPVIKEEVAEPTKIAPKRTTRAKSVKTEKRKVDKSELKRLTVIMPKEIHRRLKIKAINLDSTLNDYIVGLIRDDLGV